MKTLKIVVVGMVLVACGGSVVDDPTSSSSSVPPFQFPALQGDASAAAPGKTVAPNEFPAIKEDAGGKHFVCEINATYLECTTMPDGGPSYVDTHSVDCRDYAAGAGQGCVPPMECEAMIEGQLVQGSCVEMP
jgi:hypothetical protein